MQLHSGNIPANLKIFTRGEINITTSWDNDDKSCISPSVSVTPAFITDAGNLKTQVTAKRWSEQRGWDYKTRKQIPANPGIIEVPNTYIDDVTIVGLEKRSEGGRAYKVIIKGNLYVDLREDVLLEAFLHCSIHHGLILAKFVFAMVGSDMKLVRVGSELHKELLRLTNVAEAPSIKVADLQIGSIYRRKSSSPAGDLYLGKMYQRTITGERKHDVILHFGVGRIVEKKQLIDGINFKIGEQEAFHVFFPVDDMHRTKHVHHCAIFSKTPTAYKEKLVGVARADVLDCLRTRIMTTHIPNSIYVTDIGYLFTPTTLTFVKDEPYTIDNIRKVISDEKSGVQAA